jgi:small subunit ribosomal protein S20
MANHQSAKKSIRKNLARAERNKSRKSKIKTFVKKLVVSLKSDDTALSAAAFVTAQSQLMRGVAAGVLKKATASRKISRLNKKLKQVSLSLSA